MLFENVANKIFLSIFIIVGGKNIIFLLLIGQIAESERGKIF
jgi:hypothetical protein